MANIGAGEVRVAYLVKSEDITLVDSMIKDTATISYDVIKYTRKFRYRYLNSTEMTFQPLSGHLKGRYDRVIFCSETDIDFRERDKILFKEGNTLSITRVLPQLQHGFFAISKKAPNILELS
jgi:hypothetical protein